MVVTTVRDYLRKMSEGAEKPPPGPRGSVTKSSPGIHDSSSVVSTRPKHNLTLLNARLD
jgi:hypothetical protein